MKRRELSTRLGRIHRVGMESDRAASALAAAVLAQAVFDAQQRTQPLVRAEARAWLGTTGRRWLELLRPGGRAANGLAGRRIA